VFGFFVWALFTGARQMYSYRHSHVHRWLSLPHKSGAVVALFYCTTKLKKKKRASTLPTGFVILVPHYRFAHAAVNVHVYVQVHVDVHVHVRVGECALAHRAMVNALSRTHASARAPANIHAHKPA
jgi:hypothetical protein